MSPAESKRTLIDNQNRQVFVKGYPLLRKEGAHLAATGLPFNDLTQIFKVRTESFSVEACCHLNARGNDLLVDAIAKVSSATPLDIAWNGAGVGEPRRFV